MASSFLTIAMAVLAIVVAMAINLAIWDVGRSNWVRILGTLVIAAVMVAEHEAAAWGLLKNWEQKPPLLAVLVLAALAIAALAALSPFGRTLAKELPLVALVGFEAFRLPLELTMHRAAQEGVMPVQMSYSGYNFDILTGASALVLAILLAVTPVPMLWVRIWNIMGLVLLAVIVGIAFASSPNIAAFGKDRLNTWVSDPPFVWLPGVMVPGALLGHLLIWRKLKLPR